MMKIYRTPKHGYTLYLPDGKMEGPFTGATGPIHHRAPQAMLGGIKKRQALEAILHRDALAALPDDLPTEQNELHALIKADRTAPVSKVYSGLFGGFDRYSKKRAGKGIDLHGAVELTLRGLPVGNLDDEVAAMLKQWEDWASVFKPEPVAIEAPVFNRLHRYGGTGDLLCRLPGEPHLWWIDWKTGALYASSALQMNALAYAELVGLDGLDADGWSHDVQELPPVERALLVHVDAEGWEAREAVIRAEHMQEWLRRKQSMDWEQQWESNALSYAPITDPAHVQGDNIWEA